MSGSRDTRKEALLEWLLEVAPGMEGGDAASSDASFRRYFRFNKGEESFIAMDAPPASEDCRPFVAVARLLADAGLNVPAMVAENIEEGFLLLSDLGADTYLDVIDHGNAEQLFDDAIGALLRLQQIDAAEQLPHYDEALLRRELELFPEWYLQEHCGISVDDALRQQLDALFASLIEQVGEQARVFVHRDYMPRNLMVCDQNPGVLDFQDAVFGPISYDPICLFKDAFISWPADRIEGWLRSYWQRAGDLGLPVPDRFEDFYRDCDFMGAQRHLKVMGIFARIYHRDGKPHYLQDVERFGEYLREVAGRRPELEVLLAILDLADSHLAAGEGS